MALGPRDGDAMTRQRTRPTAHTGGVLFRSLHVARTTATFEPFTTIFAQGDRCADVMYIEKGRVRLSAMSPDGRSAVVCELQAGALFGEGALGGQRRRKSSAEAMTSCTIITVATAEMRRRLHCDVALSDWLRTQMLARNARIEQDIVTQIFNRSEKRLARALLLLAGFDEHQSPRHALPIISRNLLADMCGLTRATVDRLMNSFRKRGFLERQTLQNGGIQIHRSMMSVVLQD
jgi:CRP/FNR family transcriptional regulator, cyclic AMP receptor protein